ncbi:MAG: DUF4132 domain-containing protein [Oscillospiraceae bacterium]|nr:DUF4132 domain-containing protein [Oscillospiraceae bacterium]
MTKRPKIEFDVRRWKTARFKHGANPLRTALIDCVDAMNKTIFIADQIEALTKELSGLYAVPLGEMKTPEEFWCPALETAIAALTDQNYAARVPALLRLRMEGQISDSAFRRSYRSSCFSHFLPWAVQMLPTMVWLYYCELPFPELLGCDHSEVFGFDWLTALHLREGDESVHVIVREALLGENQTVVLSRDLIQAVILSGDEELLRLLLGMLKTAGLQEGLRQAILESADRGKLETFQQIFAFCMEENLFRFSSALRALDTWTGLAYDDRRPAVGKKFAALAFDCLSDENAWERNFQSDDSMSVYLALWGLGCRDVEAMGREVGGLVADPEPRRRVLGWYVLAQSDSSLGTNASIDQLRLAVRHLDEKDPKVLAWMLLSLPYTWKLRGGPAHREKGALRPLPNPNLPGDATERRAAFDVLIPLLDRIGSKKQTFEGNPFPFSSVTLDREQVFLCMMSLAAVDMDASMIEELTKLTDQMDTDLRRSLMWHFLQPESNPVHRKLTISFLRDRGYYTRSIAAAMLSDCPLDKGNLAAICDILRSKSGEVRSELLSLLQKQPYARVKTIPRTLLQSKNEQQLQAGIELYLLLKDKHPEQETLCREALLALEKRNVSNQTEILLQQAMPETTPPEEFTAENGWGLYDPTAVQAYQSTLEPVERRGVLDKILNRTNTTAASALRNMLPEKRQFVGILAIMDGVFTRNADYSYEAWDHFGERQTVLLGDVAGKDMVLMADEGNQWLPQTYWLDRLPLREQFEAALAPFATNPAKMTGLLYLAFAGDPRLDHWNTALERSPLLPDYLRAEQKRFARYGAILEILRHLIPQLFDANAQFAAFRLMVQAVAETLGAEWLGKECDPAEPTLQFQGGGMRGWLAGINHPLLIRLRVIIKDMELSDEGFAQWFALEHRLETAARVNTQWGLTGEAYFRAEALGLISQDVLMAFLLDDRRDLPEKIQFLTDTRHDIREKRAKYPHAEPVAKALTERLVALEMKRGELPTPLTRHCSAIMHHEGAAAFCGLLAALGQDTFYRGYSFLVHGREKREVLSMLLRRCWPAMTDTAETLKAEAARAGISEKRLAEAVMYAPQWARLAEQALGWPGLHCAVWFFHAHVNEQFSAEKETEVARYSPIEPRRFNDGTFDRAWFLQAYETLGGKRFQILYRAAKYITESGSNAHRRSQLYTDAVLGKMNQAALEAEIVQKRNQERLRAYPLLPMDSTDRGEALHRYEFIQNFRKESRQFGAQRRESERRACDAALENLAVTIGLPDVTRLTWRMESEKLRQILPQTEPTIIGDYTVRLAFADDGGAVLETIKAGKKLKTLPKELAKNETVLALKATVKELKEQKRRARETLERSMISCDVFEAGEVRGLLQNPVLAPLAERLLWLEGETVGLPRLEGETVQLEMLSGEYIPAPKTLRLAHPHDLKTLGVWPEWMRRLYETQCVQPFKQVFREYYPITSEEREAVTVSRRYAGHQIQAKKAVALLRARGWTVDYETGLQKVFYRENLVARMYALADWFSPADIEAPTVEIVEFTSRSDFEPVALESIPPILFSEVMRDLDLVVSAAHAGGVDPEASHSTVELRVALAKELVTLMKKQNITWTDRHARIQGTLSNYSVHLGSGVVHAEGVGAIHILPVHSQRRGRIFLPFADEDPKTAEILSKILLLSEDQKIKDPEILRQITE